MAPSEKDRLQTPAQACQPDSRSLALGLADISDQHRRIESYVLDSQVPEKIVTQYDVARNLYLYAFYVYRFYMPAQHQALVTLEFAIKERYGKEEIELHGKKIRRGRGLASCLRYVFDNGYVTNRDFPVWQIRNRSAAEQNFLERKAEEMGQLGLESIDLDYSDIEYDENSIEWDYLNVLSKSLPWFRNQFAHGTSMLHSQVLVTFENVSVIINKIFKP